MKRWLQKGANQKTISMLKQLILLSGNKTPSYKKTVEQLNTLGYCTSRGNPWTTQRLLRMLQRNNISGLHGLKQSTQR